MIYQTLVKEAYDTGGARAVYFLLMQLKDDTVFRSKVSVGNTAVSTNFFESVKAITDKEIVVRTKGTHVSISHNGGIGFDIFPVSFEETYPRICWLIDKLASLGFDLAHSNTRVETASSVAARAYLKELLEELHEANDPGVTRETHMRLMGANIDLLKSEQGYRMCFTDYDTSSYVDFNKIIVTSL